MKTILSSKRDHYLTKFSIFLITVALIAGMAGCVGDQYILTILRTEGGKVTSPGVGNFTYTYLDEEIVVNLVAEPDKCYRFVNWTGDVDTIADAEDATTNITMDGDYSITANFILEILEIRTWNDLDSVRDKLGCNYLLMNNLDSNTDGYDELASAAANQGKGWEPIGTSNAGFTGSFDGQGYEIRDLFVDRLREGNVGLFSLVAEGGVIKNVGVVNVAVTGRDNVGGLVGENIGTVSNSYSTGSVTGDDGVGGLVGENWYGIVSSSYSTGTVTGGSCVGGLVGRNDETTVSDSHSTGSVNGTGEYVGGLVGRNDESTVSDSHSSSHVTGHKYVGGLVGGNYEENTVSDSYSTGNVTGDVGVGGMVGYNRKSIVRNSYYNYDEVLINNGTSIITVGALSNEDFGQWLANNKSLDVNERLSQEDGYYLINDVNDFKSLLAFVQDGALKFRLTNDVDLGNDPNFYIPYFAGDFDGNSHKISNLSFNFDFVYNVGLFGCLAPGGGVTQVDVENVKITGANFIGGLVGANFEGDVSSSYSTGSVNGNYYVGGLVGRNYEESAVSSSNSTSNVTGYKYVGGLVGANSDNVSSSNSTGSVTGDEYIGGLVGWNEGEISESYSTGSVTGDEDVGGLVGQNQGTVDKSYSAGSVTGNDSVGGLVGFNDGVIVKYSYSTGNVKGEYEVGGLVGRSGKGTVSNSYSTGSVSGNWSVGGLVGCNYEESTVNSSYSTGRVSGDEDVGGLVGKNDEGRVTRSFWDIETSEQITSAAEGKGKAEGKTTEKMKDITTFTAWRIRAVDNGETNPHYTWNIVDKQNYPFLSWQSV